MCWERHNRYTKKSKSHAFYSFHVNSRWKHDKNTNRFLLCEKTSIKKSYSEKKFKTPRRILIISFHCDWCLIFEVEVVRRKVFRLESERRKTFFIFFIILKFHQSFWCFLNKENLFRQQHIKSVLKIAKMMLLKVKKEFKVFQFSRRLFLNIKEGEKAFTYTKHYHPTMKSNSGKLRSKYLL